MGLPMSFKYTPFKYTRNLKLKENKKEEIYKEFKSSLPKQM